jgi:hypothetical protein
MYYSASHHVCNNCCSVKSFNKQCRPKFIEIGHDITVSASHLRRVDATQGYKIDALETPSFHILLFSINQQDAAGSTVMLGGSKWPIQFPQSGITIISHCVNDNISISPTARGHKVSSLDVLPHTPPITISSTISKSNSTLRK